MRHVEEGVAEILKEIRAKGFNGVRFEGIEQSFQDRDEWVSDGRSLDEFEEFRSNYACFTMDPIVEFVDDATKYCGDSFDHGQLEFDLKAMFRSRLGGQLSIEYRSGCSEWEVIRSHEKPRDDVRLFTVSVERIDCREMKVWATSPEQAVDEAEFDGFRARSVESEDFHGFAVGKCDACLKPLFDDNYVSGEDCQFCMDCADIGSSSDA